MLKCPVAIPACMWSLDHGVSTESSEHGDVGTSGCRNTRVSEHPGVGTPTYSSFYRGLVTVSSMLKLTVACVFLSETEVKFQVISVKKNATYDADSLDNPATYGAISLNATMCGYVSTVRTACMMMVEVMVVVVVVMKKLMMMIMRMMMMMMMMKIDSFNA